MALDRWTSGGDYDRWMGRWSRLLAQAFLQWLDLPPGLRWIDICCGSGVLTEAIVHRNSPAAVQAIDISPDQIQFARRHRSGGNVTFYIANALSLPFADASSDVAVCGLGFNYLPNPSSGLKEFQRVLRPGGHVAIYVWDYESGARFLREFWDAAIAVDPGATAFDQATRFPMCTPKGLRDLAVQARLTAPTVQAIEITTRFTSFDDYWDPILSGQGSAPNYLAMLDAPTQAKIRERLRSALPINSTGAIEMPARAWALRARIA